MPPPAKRRKIQPVVEEITFDLSARQEFLTGFHKRKVQRTKQAQERAEQRARQDRIDERKKLREDRKAELARHVQAVNDKLKPIGLGVETSSEDSDDTSEWVELEEWTGIEDSQPEPLNHEAEYIDEDKYTTVTVETIDVTRHGISRIGQGEEERPDEVKNDEQVQTAAVPQHNANSFKFDKRPWTKQRPADKPKRPKKKRNFKYEGKIERKVNRTKEKLKNKKQAQARRAG